jgi:CubicO group peptidase (beta-lactamase class C family)
MVPSASLPTTSPVASTSTTFVPTTTTVVQLPLPNTDLFDAAIKLHTIDAGSRDVSAAVIFQGQLIHTFAASSAKSSRPVNVDTNFRIASISKILTAETVMKLVDQDLLSQEILQLLRNQVHMRHHLKTYKYGYLILGLK